MDQQIDDSLEIIMLLLIYSIHFVYVLYEFVLKYKYVHPKSFELSKSILIHDKSFNSPYNSHCCFIYSLQFLKFTMYYNLLYLKQ